MVGSDLKYVPEDFQVSEELGFSPDGEGEHLLLFLEKCQRNTNDVARDLARLAQRPLRDVGFSGMKDRNALTRQWFSIGLAGGEEPDWQCLEERGVRVLEVARHRRKLRRGVHRRNHFRIRLRGLQGDTAGLESRLEAVAREGAPNYFGEQRFGRGGANLQRASSWLLDGGRAPRREQRSIYLSSLRAFLFNTLLSERVTLESWRAPVSGDVCLLDGSHSFFTCEVPDETLLERARCGDIHPGLPLWGSGEQAAAASLVEEQFVQLGAHRELCEALVHQGAKLQYRPTRMMPDDFCWQFCDDGDLQLSFALDRGCYATALVREFVQVLDNPRVEE